MARPLIGATPRPARRHRIAFALLTFAVLALHWGALRDLGDRLGGFGAAAPMPPRIEVAYVRELEPAAPPPAAAPAPAPAPPRRAAKARKPAPAASAASAPETVVQAASVPEPVAEAGAPEPVAPLQPVTDLNEPAPVTAEAAASAPEPGVAAAEPAAAASATAAAASALPFEWPGSTRLSYRLTGNYRGEVQGSAQVEWVRVGMRYQVHVDVIVGLQIAPLFSRRMSSDGELGESGLLPLRYDEDTKVMFRERRRVTVLFGPDAVLLPGGRRNERPPGVQDSASQFVQLAYLFSLRPELLREGQSIEFPLALPRHVSVWAYDVVGEDTVHAPFGEIVAQHLVPRRVGRPGDLSVEMWIAPTLRYLPVRIRIRQDEQTYIDLVIARRPELAGP